MADQRAGGGKQNAASGDLKKPTAATIAANQAAGVPSNSVIPKPGDPGYDDGRGYFAGNGFLPQLGNYAVDLYTGGPARRLAGDIASGDGAGAYQQAVNMGGTPYGASIVGQAPGQVLAPNSGVFKPNPDNPYNGGVVSAVGAPIVGAGRGVSGIAAVQGAANLASGGSTTGVFGTTPAGQNSVTGNGSAAGAGSGGASGGSLDQMRSQFLNQYNNLQPGTAERTTAAQAGSERASSSNMGAAQTYQAAGPGAAAQAAAEMARAGTIGPAATATAQNAQAGQVGPATWAKAAQIDPTTAAQAYGVNATQLDTAPANESRNVQQEAIGATRDVLTGKAPSVAEMQLREQTNRNANAQNAIAAGARGLGMAGARRQAALNIARLNSDASEQAALLRAQEQATARTQLGALGTDTRGQDIGQATTQAGLTQDANKFTAGANQSNSQFNAGANNQRSLTQAGLTTGVNQSNAAASNQAAIAQAGIDTDTSQGNANRQTQTSQFNAGANNQVNTAQAGLDTQTSLGNANNATGVSQFNAGQTNENNQFTANAINQAGQFNAGAVNQRTQAQSAQDTGISQYNAGLTTQNNQFNAGQQNTVGTANADRSLNQSQLNEKTGADLRNDAISAGVGAANAQNQVVANERAQRQDNLNLISNGAKSLAAAYAASDKRLKTNVGRPSEGEVRAFLTSIKPVEFDYTAKAGELGDGKRHVGVMAQDVDNTTMGRGFITDTPKGKAIEAGNAVGPMLVALRHLNDRIDQMDARRRKAAVEMR